MRGGRQRTGQGKAARGCRPRGWALLHGSEGPLFGAESSAADLDAEVSGRRLRAGRAARHIPRPPSCCRFAGVRLGGVKEDDAAGRLPGLQGLHGVVDFAEVDTVGHHLVQMQLALHVELHEARHVHPEAVGAHE